MKFVNIVHETKKMYMIRHGNVETRESGNMNSHSNSALGF